MEKQEIVTSGNSRPLFRCKRIKWKSESHRIEASTRPLEDVEGFDSLCRHRSNGQCFPCTLGIAIPDNCNPFHLGRWESGVVC